MGRCIVKLHDARNGKDWYLEWSSICDAPLTRGMSREELTTYLVGEYGRDGARALDARLARVDAKGVSAVDHPGPAESFVAYNRAGKEETCLSVEQLLDYYCMRMADGEPPIGTRWHDDSQGDAP